jgi:hypothetical protein
MTQSADLHDAVRTILLNDWDPIGVRDVPEAQDEYDSYAPAIARLVAAGTSVSDLSAHLLEIETDAMGLRGDASRAHSIAEKLRAL